MSRTNIELDDELVAEVMRRYGVTTKRDAIGRSHRLPQRRHDATVVHRDTDFDVIAEITSLEARSFR